MQISSSYSITQKPLGITSQGGISQAGKEQESSRVQSTVKQQISVDSEQTQKNNNDKSQQRLEINEQAIASFESQQSASHATLLSQNESQSPANQGNYFAKNTRQDKASQQNKTAISAYQNVDNIAQRESVQALFGVDLLA